MRVRRVVAMVAVGALVVSACASGSGGELATTTEATTTTAAAATTGATTTRTQATWDLVAFGDSMVDGYGVPPGEGYVYQYATLLSNELGILVDVRLLQFGSNERPADPETVAQWAEVFAAPDESLRPDLAEAEIVTLFLGAHNIGLAVFGGCSGEWPDPLEACFRQATETMPADYDRLLASIRDLVPEETTILVGYDGGLPPAAAEEWSDEPFWPEMRRILVDEWRPGLYAAAEAHGAIVIGFYEALGGAGEPLHPELLQSDGLHFNAEGHRFLAELHLAQDGLGKE